MEGGDTIEIRESVFVVQARRRCHEERDLFGRFVKGSELNEETVLRKGRALVLYIRERIRKMKESEGESWEDDENSKQHCHNNSIWMMSHTHV